MFLHRLLAKGSPNIKERCGWADAKQGTSFRKFALELLPASGFFFFRCHRIPNTPAGPFAAAAANFRSFRLAFA